MPIRIGYDVARQIADQAEAKRPREACGLIAGDGMTIELALPLENVAASPESRFRVDAREQLRALKQIDERELRWMGVYHSHTRSAPNPSPADIREAADDNLLHLIVSLEANQIAFKLWRISQDSVDAVDLVFVGQTDAADDSPPSAIERIVIVLAGVASLLLLLAIAFALLPPAPRP